jgi:hypothetical protein
MRWLVSTEQDAPILGIKLEDHSDTQELKEGHSFLVPVKLSPSNCTPVDSATQIIILYHLAPL